MSCNVTLKKITLIVAGVETNLVLNNLNLQGVIIMRGVGISMGGFSATDYSVGLAAHSNKPFYTPNLTTYADNTAALASGLVAGMWYKTSAGDIKIVI